MGRALRADLKVIARHRLRDAVLRRAGGVTRRRTTSSSDTILIFQPDHLGDILLSQPAVSHIRNEFPAHWLIGVVGPWSEAIARRVWNVDDIVCLDFPGFNRDSAMRDILGPYRQLLDEAENLKALDASVSFVLRPDAWWAAWLAALVTGGPVVTSGDPRVVPFATHHAPINERHHATTRALSIARALSTHSFDADVTPRSAPLSIPEQPEVQDEARRFLHDIGVAGEYIVIHPGAGADVKQWPADRWRFVASQLGRENLTVLVTGSRSESALGVAISTPNPWSTSIAGQTPLPLLIEILRGARLVLGPDCGPLHLAVASGAPTVHLFGPSDPVRYGPWGPPNRHRVVSAGWSCPRCGDLSLHRPAGCGCMTAIEPGVVLDAARAVLDCHADR